MINKLIKERMKPLQTGQKQAPMLTEAAVPWACVFEASLLPLAACGGGGGGNARVGQGARRPEIFQHNSPGEMPGLDLDCCSLTYATLSDQREVIR